MGVTSIHISDDDPANIIYVAHSRSCEIASSIMPLVALIRRFVNASDGFTVPLTRTIRAMSPRMWCRRKLCTSETIERSRGCECVARGRFSLLLSTARVICKLYPTASMYDFTTLIVRTTAVTAAIVSADAGDVNIRHCFLYIQTSAWKFLPAVTPNEIPTMKTSCATLFLLGCGYPSSLNGRMSTSRSSLSVFFGYWIL